MRDSLGFLSYAIPGLVRSTVGYDGRVFDALIRRSADLGFRPVLKDIYSIYWNTVQVKRDRMHVRVPDDIFTASHTFDQNFEHDAMVELTEAIH